MLTLSLFLVVSHRPKDKNSSTGLQEALPGHLQTGCRSGSAHRHMCSWVPGRSTGRPGGGSFRPEWGDQAAAAQLVFHICFGVTCIQRADYHPAGEKETFCSEKKIKSMTSEARSTGDTQMLLYGHIPVTRTTRDCWRDPGRFPLTSRQLLKMTYDLLLGNMLA